MTYNIAIAFFKAANFPIKLAKPIAKLIN